MAFSLASEFEVDRCRLLGFLDEGVQQNHPFQAIYAEKDAGYSPLGEIGSDFEEALTQRAAERHSKWPAKLYCLDVLADLTKIIPEWEAFDPLPDGLPSGSNRKKTAGILFIEAKSKCTVYGARHDTPTAQDAVMSGTDWCRESFRIFRGNRG